MEDIKSHIRNAFDKTLKLLWLAFIIDHTELCNY